MSFVEHRSRIVGAFPDDIIVLKGASRLPVTTQTET